MAPNDASIAMAADDASIAVGMITAVEDEDDIDGKAVLEIVRTWIADERCAVYRQSVIKSCLYMCFKVGAKQEDI